MPVSCNKLRDTKDCKQPRAPPPSPVLNPVAHLVAPPPLMADLINQTVLDQVNILQHEIENKEDQHTRMLEKINAEHQRRLQRLEQERKTLVEQQEELVSQLEAKRKVEAIQQQIEENKKAIRVQEKKSVEQEKEEKFARLSSGRPTTGGTTATGGRAKTPNPKVKAKPAHPSVVKKVKPKKAKEGK